MKPLLLRLQKKKDKNKKARIKNKNARIKNENARIKIRMQG